MAKEYAESWINCGTIKETVRNTNRTNDSATDTREITTVQHSSNTPPFNSASLGNGTFELQQENKNLLTKEQKLSGLAISFGWTAQYLPNKTCTRRDWKDTHAEKFIRAYDKGLILVALDKDKRYGGKQIGTLQLTRRPYKELLSNMPESDVLAEGGMVETRAQFIDKYFDGDDSKELWVIWFEFTSLEQLQAPEQKELLNGRHALDRYDSPHWFVSAVTPYVKLSGTVGECCYGSGIIARCLQAMGCAVWSNDIDRTVKSDYYLDATVADNWRQFPESDWIYSNPPYGADATAIIKNAYNHATRGVVMLLRTTWDEPCEDRADWLFEHPYARKITLPRFKFRKDKEGKRWSTDSCTIAAYIWDKKIKCQPSLSIPSSKIALFHDNPENAPSWEAIEELLKPRIACTAKNALTGGNVQSGYLYQRKKGDKLIWEYRYDGANYYVSVGRVKRVRDAIDSGVAGADIINTVFTLNRCDN